MDKIEYIKLENEDGSYSEPIALSTNSDHIDINGKTLTEAIGNMDFEEDGSITEQIIKLKNKDISIDEKLDTTVYINDIINDLNSEEEKKPLSAKQGKELKNKINFYKNVKNYGASGNGIDNDTQAIQLLLNQGGSIYFPDGTYLISSPLSIKSEVKSIILSSGASILANNIMDSIFLIEGGSNNLLISGGVIDCNAKAKKGIYSTVYIGSPTFENIKIMNATECGLQLRDEEHIGGSCHGYLDRVKVYNKETLATCIGLYVHDMQITDCELFYTNCGIEIKADMQTITGVHIWAGGKDNSNSNTYGIKYEPSGNATQLSLSNIYFDGMNVSIYATKGIINMENIIFFNPSEGTYDNPIALLSYNMYNTYWNLGKYYLNSVVPMALMDYEYFDNNNIVAHDNRISKYNHTALDNIFKDGYIDFGCNYNFLEQNYLNITTSYVTKFNKNKYYLFGYYLLRPTNLYRQENIDIRITNKHIGIDHEVHVNFGYYSTDTITIWHEKIYPFNQYYFNTNFSISLGNIEEKTSLLGNSVKVIPLYLHYEGDITDYISIDDFIVTNLTKDSPACLMLFRGIEKQNNEISLLRTYKFNNILEDMLSQNQSKEIFISKKSIYKIFIYSHGNEKLYDNFLEYNVARYNTNVSIVRIFKNGNIVEPTINFDENTEMLTITAPNGQWYYIKAVHN